MNYLFVREFASDLGCATCISSGYVYYYGTQARSDITDADGIEGYCCREQLDGTLYCGDEMDKIFDIYLGASADITDARIEKVRESYHDLVLRSGDPDSKTKAQALYLDLFTAAKTFEDDADDVALVEAFDDVEFEMLAYYNSPTADQAVQFIDWLEKLETDFPADGGDAVVSGDGPNLVEAHFAQDFADQTESDFDAIRGTVLIQALVGKTLEAKFTAAYDVVAASADKASLATATDVVMATYLHPDTHTIQSGGYDTDDTMIQQILIVYFTSDTAYTLNQASTEFAKNLSLSGDGLDIYNDLLFELFEDGASVLTNESYIEKATRLVPYLATADGTADYQAFLHFKALDEDKEDVATVAIYDAFEEFFDASDATLRFDGLLMFQKINQETLDSATETALEDCLIDYMDAIKMFDSDGELNVAGCDQTNRFVFEMIGTDDISTITDLDDKLTMLSNILILSLELYDASDVLNSVPNPIGAAASIAGMTMLTFGGSQSIFDDATTVFDDPSTLAATTEESTMLTQYKYFFPTFAGTETSELFTDAQCADIDTTDIGSSGANSAFAEAVEFLGTTSGTTYGQMQTDAEDAWRGDLTPASYIDDFTAQRTFNQAIFQAMAMMTGTDDFNTKFTTENLYEMFGVTASSYQDLSQADIEALDVSGGVSNDVQTFITAMGEIGTATAPTRGDYPDVFTPSAAAAQAAPVVGEKQETPAEASADSITLSNQFSEPWNAVFSCPNHEDHCGVGLHDATSSSVTLTPQLFKPEQSCHYVVKVDGCGYPSVEVIEQDDFQPYWNAIWMEYQTEMTTMDENDTDYLATDVSPYFNPFSYTLGSSVLGNLVLFKEEGTKIANASQFLQHISLRKYFTSIYNLDLANYEEAVEDYNAAVTTIQGEIPGWKDGTLTIGETRGPRGNRETALTELPLRPIPPPTLDAYMGYTIGVDAEFLSGFGAPTIGVFAEGSTETGNYKNFGMIGQDFSQLQFTSGKPDDGSTCDTKYVAISVFPYVQATYPIASAFLDPGLDGNGDQTFHDQWEFTISNVEDVDAPTVELTEDEAAEVVPTAPKASPFILTEGGVKLAASATLAAALAFSLY